MADLDVTKKVSIYHLLYRINLSFANIVRRCRGLEATGMFRPKYLKNFQGFAQELQAEINEELLDTLYECELDDWHRYGKVRAAWEKYLRDPDDVFIHAEERRRQLAKQGKTPPRVGKLKGYPRRRILPRTTRQDAVPWATVYSRLTGAWILRGGFPTFPYSFYPRSHQKGISACQSSHGLVSCWVCVARV